jgi:ATP-dependent DNA helicase PIF1
MKMAELSGPCVRYSSIDDCPNERIGELANLPVDSTLRLKTGATVIPSLLPFVVVLISKKVMLVRNLSEELVNGTIGTVLGFARVAREKDPDLEESLSDPEKEFYNLNDKNALLPVVRWVIPGVDDVSPVLVRPIRFEIESGIKGVPKVSRKQLPIILSYAISVHKAQGQTLDRVVLDMRGFFAAGQAYVALTRCRSADRLHITHWDRNSIKVDPTVHTWYTQELPKLVSATEKRMIKPKSIRTISIVTK